MLKIVVADNQFLTHAGIVAFLQKLNKYLIVDNITNNSQLLQSLEKETIDLLIIDTKFPNVELPEIKRLYPNLNILILVQEICPEVIKQLSNQGFKNIISKNIDKEDFFIAVEYTLKNKTYYSDELIEILIDKPKSKKTEKHPTNLTTTERDIVSMIADGLTSKEIATRKNISAHTAMTHRKNIFRKLNINSSSELIMYAIKAGWIDNIEYYI